MFLLQKFFIKVYIWLGKITHLSLHIFPFLFSLKSIKICLIIYMKKYDFQEKRFQKFDPIESYFECISTCDIKDGNCISKCVEILKQNDG